MCIFGTSKTVFLWLVFKTFRVAKLYMKNVCNWPWQAGDATPLLDTELAGSIAASQCCKSLKWNTWCASDKLQETKTTLIVVTLNCCPEPLYHLMLVVVTCTKQPSYNWVGLYAQWLNWDVLMHISIYHSRRLYKDIASMYSSMAWVVKFRFIEHSVVRRDSYSICVKVLLQYTLLFTQTRTKYLNSVKHVTEACTEYSYTSVDDHLPQRQTSNILKLIWFTYQNDTRYFYASR